MKSNFSFSLALCFGLFLQISTAQTYIPFPTDSAQWSVRHTHNYPFTQNSFQYKMKGDTVINGLNYSKIYYSLDLDYSSLNQTLYCFLREDSTKKVFVKYPMGSGVDTTEMMLYNFNCVLGDTITIKLFHYTTDSIFKLKVCLIDSIQVIGGTRKYYALCNIGNTMWGGSCENFFHCIEGIGLYLNPFYNEIPEEGCDNGIYQLSCFWQNGAYVWGGTECDYITNVEGNHNTLTPIVYPNPVSYISLLKFTKTVYSDLTIFNTIGTVVKSIGVKDKEEIALSRSDFKSGIYFFKLSTPSGHCHTGKFIVL